MTRDLLLSFGKQPEIIIGEGILVSELKISGDLARSSSPPWPALADVLFDPRDRLLLGVCYFADDANKSTAYTVASVLSSPIIRFIPDALGLERYHNLEKRMGVLEITWHSTETMNIDCAQAIDNWYYRAGFQGNPAHVIGYGIPDVDQLLRSYDLALPNFNLIPR